MKKQQFTKREERNHRALWWCAQCIDQKTGVAATSQIHGGICKEAVEWELLMLLSVPLPALSGNKCADIQTPQ